MTPPVIEAKGITRSFGGLRVLDGLDLSVSPGEFLAVTGRSGTGKSTMLGILGTHDLAFEGSLTVGGRDIRSLDPEGLAALRREFLGYVFQDFHLLPELSAMENAVLPAVFSGACGDDPEEQAREVLEHLGVRIDGTPTSKLSRGERQRVAVARGLINRPRVLLADEPSASLDEESENTLFDLLDGLRRARGFSLVAVVHSRAVLSRADRVMALGGGRLHVAS